MEKTIQTLKLDNKELIEELKEIQNRNSSILNKIIKAHTKGVEPKGILEALSENTRKLIDIIVVLEYLEGLESEGVNNWQKEE